MSDLFFQFTHVTVLEMSGFAALNSILPVLPSKLGHSLRFDLLLTAAFKNLSGKHHRPSSMQALQIKRGYTVDTCSALL